MLNCAHITFLHIGVLYISNALMVHLSLCIMNKYSFQYLLVVLSESCKNSDQQTTFEHDHFFHRTIADNSVKLKHMFFEKGFVDAVRNDLRSLLQIKKIVLRIWYENRQIVERNKTFLFLSLSLRKGYILTLDIPILSLFGLIRHCITQA